MASLLLSVFCFLCLGLVASHAATVEPSQVYWKKVLPNSPMPKALSDLLHPPEWVNMGVGNAINVAKDVRVGVMLKYPFNKAVRTTGHVDPADRAHFRDSKTVEVSVSLKYKQQDQKLEDQKLQDPKFRAKAAAIFFLENKLNKGTQMKLIFTKTTTPGATFLPSELAKKMPFSSKKLPEILKYFSLKPSSKEAAIMKKTIEECEDAAVKGEDKYCASSLESMIDFATSKLGKKVNAFSMEANRESDEMQEYTIVGVKKMGGGKSIACHSQKYAYAVFYCHSLASTEAYSLSLVGKNGARAKAVGVCHMDTTQWNADNVAFKVLNVKPGTVPVCHLLPQGHVLWAPY